MGDIASRIHGSTILTEIQIGEVGIFVLFGILFGLAVLLTVLWGILSKGFKKKMIDTLGFALSTKGLVIGTWVVAALLVGVIGLVTDWFKTKTVNLGSIPITTTLVVTWGVMIVLTGLCIFLTRGLRVRDVSTRQTIAEFLVNTVENMVKTNMGPQYEHYAPFIAGIFAMSVFCSLSALLGLEPPTADVNTELGWAIFVFFLITKTKIATNGLLGYGKSFLDPIFVMAPFNVLGEVFKPISMSFRHFGNVLSGSVISALLYAALAAASAALLSLIPGVVGDLLSKIPIFDVGIPAILSVYFDWFSGVMQAFIFCMLTMMFISAAAEKD